MRSIYVVMFLLASISLHAQNQRGDTSRVYKLPEFMVIDKYHIQDVKSSAPTQTFSYKQLQLLNALQLSDAVKYFSGVSVKDYGGIGGLKTVSIRSLGAEHTGVSYDGVALTDYQTGQIDIGRYSLENIDHLSLSIGQNNNIFQPARMFASAGLLNIVTLSPSFKESKRNILFNFKTGSWGFINPSFRYDRLISEHWSATANAEWLSTDGCYPFTLHYSNAEGNITSKEKRNNTSVQNLKLESELFGNFKNKEQFRLKIYYYRSSRGLPGATTYYYNHSSQHLWDKNLFIQAHYQKEYKSHFAFQSSAKWNWSYEHYLDPDYANSEGKTENSYFQQEYYLTSSLLYRMTENFSVSVSSDESYNKLNANLNDFAYPTRLTWLSNVAMKYVNNLFVINASALSTATSEDVKVGEAGKNYHKITPFIGVSLFPLSDKNLTIRFFYKDIFRLPTFNDLYYTSIGTRSLKPERTYQTNVGITYAIKDKGFISFVTASIDAYHNKVNDKIIAVPTKNLFIWSMTNLGKVDMKGFDTNATLSIIPYRTWLIDMTVNYSYLKALDKTDSNSKNYNQQIAYTPRISSTGQLSITSPWCTLSYTYLFSGKRYMLGENTSSNRLASYSDHSLSISRNLLFYKLSLRCSFELLNILNKNYEIVKNFPMAGRSFRIGINIKI